MIEQLGRSKAAESLEVLNLSSCSAITDRCASLLHLFTKLRSVDKIWESKVL
jgi:hypothetical protein